MEATLKFDLNDIDEREIHKKCVDITSMSIALYEFDNKLRSILKYSDDSANEKYLEGIQHARDLLWEYLNEQEVGYWVL